MRVIRSRLFSALVVGCVIVAVAVGAFAASTRWSFAHPGAKQAAAAAADTTAGIDVVTSSGVMQSESILTLTATCPTGEQLVGGGYFGGVAQDNFGNYGVTGIFSSYPSSLTTWTVFGWNFTESGVPLPLGAYAECVHGANPFTMRIASSTTPSLLDGAVDTATAACNAGETLTGGGFAINATPPYQSLPQLTVSTSAPEGATGVWQAAVEGIDWDPSNGLTFQAYALCAQGQGLTASVTTAPLVVPPTVIDAQSQISSLGENTGTLACPQGSGLLTAGGFTYDGDATNPQYVLATYPSDASASTWTVTDLNGDLNGVSATENGTEAVVCVQFPTSTITINPLANLSFAEGSPYKVTDFFTDTDNTASSWTVSVDFGDQQSNSTTRFPVVQSPTTGGPLTGLYFTLNHRYGDAGTYTVTVTVTDDVGETASTTATLTVNDAPITITKVTISADPVAVGAPTNASAKYTDPGTLDQDTALWYWGDGGVTNAPVTINKTTGNDSVAKTPHIYSAANLYTLSLGVSNNDGSSQINAVHSIQYIIVYSPTSSANGSGAFVSPAGAYRADPSATGPATFSLACKYSGGKTPKCSTQMQFPQATLTFQATTALWLVVAGDQARIEGTGTLNGASGYSYLLAVSDAQAAGNGGVAQYRLAIYNTATGAVVYDTQSGTPISNPTTPLTSGSVTLHG